MEQFDSSVEESSKVSKQQQRNNEQQCPSCAVELTEALVEYRDMSQTVTISQCWRTLQNVAGSEAGGFQHVTSSFLSRHISGKIFTKNTSQTFWHRLPIFQVDLHCALHRVATSSCHGHVDELATEPFLFAASMEQATDEAETAAIDGLVSSWSENISVSFCLRVPGYGLTLWCTLGLLVGGAIEVPQLQLPIQSAVSTLSCNRQA